MILKIIYPKFFTGTNYSFLFNLKQKVATGIGEKSAEKKDVYLVI